MTTRNGRRELTPEQREKSDARRAQFKALAQQIATMTETERAALAAKMAAVVTIEGRVLSVHNACLLACQRPDATMVGGFNQWRANGRMVRKGEHGLMIWAPIQRGERGQIASDRLPTDALKDSDARPNFIMVTVFDVAQTEGA